MEEVRLVNGVRMPLVGFGVWRLEDGKQCEEAVSNALTVGYRSIDTAQMYQNEDAVGRAIKKSGIKREDLFITTKVDFTVAGEQAASESIAGSLRKLQLDYVDLLLIHAPFNDYYGSYRALETAYRTAKARAIGVSNFYPDRFLDLVKYSDIPPMVNQMETHIFNQQLDSQSIYERYGAVLESWGPLAQGKHNFFNHPVLTAIGEKYGKTVAQVALRYNVQRGIVVIPKTVHKKRMAENIDIFDFVLSSEDMATIEALDKQQTNKAPLWDANRVIDKLGLS